MKKYRPHTHCRRGLHEMTPENTIIGTTIRNGKRHVSHACKACHKAWPGHKANARKQQLKSSGWTPELYEAVSLAQNGGCAICGKPCSTGARLAGDHNHLTGKPRGLLCKKHNLLLGYADDSVDVLLAAAEYLRKYEAAK